MPESKAIPATVLFVVDTSCERCEAASLDLCQTERESDCVREREGRRVRILIEINECFVTDRGNQVGFGTGESEVPKAQLASLKCMVQTVRILNIDWVCLNGSPRLT